MTQPTRATITPFRRNGIWWARVPRLGAVSVQRSLETRDVTTARAMCAFLWSLKNRREHFALEAMASGDMRIGEAFDAYRSRRLESYLADRQAGKQDPDVEPYVAQWLAAMAKRRRPNAQTAAKYGYQVRTLLRPGVAFKRSELTRRRIAEWLDGLAVGQPNRYRAALSRFCRYLVERDVLDVNPVRSVESSRENAPRCRYLSDAEAAKLLAAIEPKFRLVHGLMLATGVEVSAVLALKRLDVDLAADTLHARGTKRAARDRTVRLSWTIPALAARCEALLPGAPLFPGLTPMQSLRALQRACVAVGIDDYRQHDHRHTYAVRELRRGQSLQVVAHQLGHANTIMVQKVYGRFIPAAEDYAAGPLHQSATMTDSTNAKA